MIKGCENYHFLCVFTLYQQSISNGNLPLYITPFTDIVAPVFEYGP